MTVHETEVKRIGRKKGWDEKRVSRILEQSRDRKPKKAIAGDTFVYDMAPETDLFATVDTLNGIGEVMVLSEGTYVYKGKDVKIDAWTLSDMLADAKDHAVDVYVAHKYTHDIKVGKASDWRIKARTDDKDKLALYASVSFPSIDVNNELFDHTLQKDVIAKMEKKEITKVSPSFSLHTITLSDGNKYVSGSHIAEVSLIPEIGVELTDGAGVTSVNNVAPVSDAHIEEFIFAEGQIDFYENKDDKVIVNINGKGYMCDTADSSNELSNGECSVKISGIAGSKDIEGYSKVATYNIKDGRFKIGNVNIGVNVDDKNIMFKFS